MSTRSARAGWVRTSLCPASYTAPSSNPFVGSSSPADPDPPMKSSIPSVATRPFELVQAGVRVQRASPKQLSSPVLARLSLSERDEAVVGCPTSPSQSRRSPRCLAVRALDLVSPARSVNSSVVHCASMRVCKARQPCPESYGVASPCECSCCSSCSALRGVRVRRCESAELCEVAKSSASTCHARTRSHWLALSTAPTPLRGAQ